MFTKSIGHTRIVTECLCLPPAHSGVSGHYVKSCDKVEVFRSGWDLANLVQDLKPTYGTFCKRTTPVNEPRYRVTIAAKLWAGTLECTL